MHAEVGLDLGADRQLSSARAALHVVDSWLFAQSDLRQHFGAVPKDVGDWHEICSCVRMEHGAPTCTPTGWLFNMLDFTSCNVCQRQLRDAIFCPQCGQSSCCWECHARHVSRHAEKVPTKERSTPGKAPDTFRRERWN